ncbi:MAG: LysR family transcriptional regulator [Burkholderiaceae bacterium]|nr:LysR family transcriptional regulator [Burkholderiaceae bacterium]
MKKIDDINAWKIFQSLAQSRSLSSTADEYDQDVSTISRTIAGLEKVLGQDLIYRNVRPIQLTEVGQRAYELVTPLLQIHREMISEIQAGVAPLQGKIRLSQAQGFVERFMIPLLLEFNSVYPEISFEVVGGGNINDILQFKADVAVVSFQPQNPHFISLSRGRNVYVPVASPEYIRQNGLPLVPQDLAKHTVLAYDGPVRGATRSLFNEAGEECPVVWNKIIRVGNILAIKRSVMDGFGISVDMPLLHCADEISKGKLVPVLPGWIHPPVECFLVTSKSNWRIRRHRIFAEWYSKRLKEFFDDMEHKVSPFWSVPKQTKIVKI